MELQEHGAPECPDLCEDVGSSQVPAPWWHSVFTAPHAALWLFVCQGVAGVGTGSTGARLPPARAQTSAAAHGEGSRDGNRAWGQPWPSCHPHTALFPGADPRLAPSQSWPEPDSSAEREDCRANWGAWGQQFVDTNDDKPKLLQWRLNSFTLLILFIWSPGSPCAAATVAKCFSTFWGARCSSSLSSQKV